jgi:hypothetical protein
VAAGSAGPKSIPTLIHRHIILTRKVEKEIKIDRNRMPMVMEELTKLGKRPPSGPIIISEFNGAPLDKLRVPPMVAQSGQRLLLRGGQRCLQGTPWRPVGMSVPAITIATSTATMMGEKPMIIRCR